MFDLDHELSSHLHSSRNQYNFHLNPLKIWEVKTDIFPNLLTIATKKFGIVATSVPTKNLFSTSGQIPRPKKKNWFPKMAMAGNMGRHGCAKS